MKKTKKVLKRNRKFSQKFSSIGMRTESSKSQSNKTRAKVRVRAKTSSKTSLEKKVVTLSVSSHLQVDRPTVIAPSEGEKNLALKTLSMIYQNSEFSGDETRVFRSFLDRFSEGDMRKEDLYAFLRNNPSIRKKFWESDVFE